MYQNPTLAQGLIMQLMFHSWCLFSIMDICNARAHYAADLSLRR